MADYAWGNLCFIRRNPVKPSMEKKRGVVPYKMPMSIGKFIPFYSTQN